MLRNKLQFLKMPLKVLTQVQSPLP